MGTRSSPAPTLRGATAMLPRDRRAARATAASQLAIGAGWWWLGPHGFDLTDRGFWLHQMTPTLLAAIAIASWWVPRTALVLSGFWAGLGALCLVLYQWEGAPVALLGGVWAATLWLSAPARKRSWRLGAAGLLAGGGAAAALRAPPPSTHPRTVVEESTRTDAASTRWYEEQGVWVTPALTVFDRSRHRFQTVFGPPAEPIPSWQSTSRPRPGVTRIHAESVLVADRYAHLSTYSEVTLALSDPHVSFAPCEGLRFPVTERDDRWGAPARIAVVDSDRSFRVVQAASAEKGPYDTLCTGELPPDEPLEVVFYEGREPVLAVRWEDYASQLSTEPSPAAGWGMPQNAVVFWRDGARVTMVLSLASTGVGIGWASVGLAKGTYVNRMELTHLGPRD